MLKNKDMKAKYLLLGVFLAFQCLAFSQNTYSYHYDANGNRDYRIIVLKKSATAATEDGEAANDSTLIEKKYTDRIGEATINIFPNPTAGIVTLQIENMQQVEGELLLIDSKGAILQNIKTESTPIDIDLSGYTNGAYILKIRINGNTTEWKIIKK
jgi:hypothetical protein